MRKVLVVDDEPSILRSTAALLEDCGYQVATCAEPTRILQTIAQEQPDIILHDVRMPGLNIEEMVPAIRRQWRDLPIVLFTAGMDSDEIRQRVQANGVIEKPLRPRDLVAAIESVLPAPA